MLRQEKKAGGKEFFAAVCVICVLVMLASVAGAIVRNSFAGDIIALILFCVYGYFVLVRYGAVYTYTVTENNVRINRQIGKRNKEAELKKKEIIKITEQKPEVKTVYNFSRFIFKRKNVVYIVFDNEGTLSAAIVEANPELREALGRLVPITEN